MDFVIITGGRSVPSAETSLTPNMITKEMEALPVLEIKTTDGKDMKAIIIKDILREMGKIEYEVDKAKNFKKLTPQDYEKMWLVFKGLLFNIDNHKRGGQNGK